MRNIRAAFLCAGTNFRKWRKNPTVLLMLIFWTLFLVAHFIEVPAISLRRGSAMVPWLMPFVLMRPLDRFLYNMMLIVLFAQAPFNDVSTPFSMVRTGRLTWFWGQILYIFGTAAVVTLITFAGSALMTAPCMDLQLDWGPRTYKMVLDVALGSDGVAEQIVSKYSVWEALWHTAKLQFLTASLIGAMVLFFNMFRQGVGVLVTGAAAAWTLFATWGQGTYIYTRSIYRTAILNWSSLFSLYPIVEKEGVAMGEAVTTMLTLIAVFLIGSVILYYRRDVHFTRNNF